MTPKNGNFHNGRPPESSTASTVKPNGRRIEKLRKDMGWSRSVFGQHTDKAVWKAAFQCDDPDPELVRRIKERKRYGGHPGLGLSTLHKLAHGKRVYPLTVKIAALTLGVSTESLIIPD